MSPPILSFTSWPGGLGPPLQPLTIDRRGTGVVPWQARVDVPWLRIAPAEGTTPTVVWVTATLPSLLMSLQDSASVVSGVGNFNPAGGQRRLLTEPGG